ncbi:sugar ABC transporter substrate-binding protein [Alicyclobacillus acidoterrestris]|uniref:Sugar ABC transporter substrate-binding protein n=1 Tax=Alicyclobacillus acidoterrestris (strain ATCC 49025 / DSM 3922 / CIP 106132 / NCIMB 13137 / GD3B) TaxID=1356854 RepID=T0CIM7_ALIAG|nr:sugar ABC transporter substrate-binding protein [Alicyclobacillus acidoterrestris]EPZ52644.1 hypothetical protein N007_20010 [Alicyclobacillus acidoterrestris ATCC 49025]UNO49953.1 sugar ABC transporter substrate-binding protein [Alicyclobacillus acidoterrestris]
MKRQMKKLILPIAAALVFAAGCGTQAATSNAATSNTSGSVKVKPVHIAVVSLYDNDEWSAQFLSGIKAAAQAYPDVTLTETQASYNQAEMVSQLQAVIAQHPDVIIVNHASQPSALAPAVQQAINQGIKVISVEADIPVKGVAHANENNQQLATLSLNALAQGIHNRGNIAVIWVGGFTPMVQREVSLKAFEKAHPDIHVIATYGDASNTTISDTMARTEALLRQYPNAGQLSAIWASWDQFAIGAVKAEQALQRNVPIYGIDVSNQDLALMKQSNSPWKATAANDVYQYGTAMVNYALRDAYGESIPSSIWIPGALIEQSKLPPQGENIHDFFLSILPSETSLGSSPLLQQLEKEKQ